jgi:hypothetical protein
MPPRFCPLASSEDAAKKVRHRDRRGANSCVDREEPRRRRGSGCRSLD